MAIAYLSPSSLISTITFSQRRRTIKASKDSVKTQKTLIATNSVSSFRLCPCGRRHFIGGVMTSMPLLPLSPSYAASSSMEDFKRLLDRPPKPDWYDELFAWSMDTSMEPYEKEISSYKMKLFDNLVGKAEKVLEIGVGTGPNFKYLSAIPNVSVLGVDPNAKMESYACKSAAQAGLKPEDFSFIHAVAEAIPLEDASVEAVVGTLVLCSVTDVTRTLNEIKRVLRPGGVYLFIEHVAGEDGSFLRLVQNVLDPLQQAVADGCHLTRRTGDYISEARFSGGVDINKIADCKRAEIVLDICVGTGSNLKYYSDNENAYVLGVDPNHTVCGPAREAGRKPENFRFIWIFLRNVQNVLDPLQLQVVADGCHLTRNTGLYILAVGFDDGTEVNTAAIYSFPFPWITRAHVYGVAYK